MAYISDSFMHRSLDDNEEKEFRVWARENWKNIENWRAKMDILHPVVLDEWDKIAASFLETE